MRREVRMWELWEAGEATPSCEVSSGSRCRYTAHQCDSVTIESIDSNEDG